MYPNFAIWVTHLVPVVVWKKQLELEWDVLGLSSTISYLLFGQLVVHLIISRERFTGLVSSVFWHLGLKPGQWGREFEESGEDRACDGEMVCGVPLKDRKCSEDLSMQPSRYSVCGWCGKAWQIKIVWASWAYEWGWLGIVLQRCVWRWRGWNMWAGAEKHEESVWRMIWNCLVCSLSGPCSGICGSRDLVWGKRLTLAQRGRKGRFPNKWLWRRRWWRRRWWIV